jgi:hypothetical protein
MSRRIGRGSAERIRETEDARTTATRGVGGRAPHEPDDEDDETVGTTRRLMSRIRNVLGD